MKRFLLTLAAVLATTAAKAEPFETIAWSGLVDPSAQAFDDPFATLEYENIERLVRIVRLRGAVEDMPASAPQRSEAEAEIDTLISALEAQGLDAEWLISQRWVVADRREKAATAGNPQMDGRQVVIAGFAIPAPPAQDGTKVVYLVPERGMCSHMPPPNANQMIRARMPDGWTPSVMHEPLRLTGQVSISPSEQTFRIVDGPVAMNATFAMEVARFETINEMRGASPQVNAWAEDIAERLRASGQLRPRAGAPTE